MVVRALRERLPALRLTICTTLRRPVLAELFGEPFELVNEPPDPGGLVMTSPFDVDVEASADAYAAFHANWDARVRHDARALAELAPDALLADVPYLPIAAAALAGIPAFALCSLNWADLYRHYCGHRPEARRIHRQILSAYREADAFLIPEPGMPMPDLGNVRPIGPCARLGRDRRDEICRRLGLARGTRLVLVAMGGIDWHFDLANWSVPAETHLIVYAAEVPALPGISDFSQLGLPMIDVLRSSDAVVTKIGYGILTEAACNGTALLYVTRDDWPEARYGYEWASPRMRAAPITRQQLEAGDFDAALERLLAMPSPPPVMPTGGAEAADILLGRLCE